MADQRVHLHLALAAFLLGAFIYALMMRRHIREAASHHASPPLTISGDLALWSLTFAGLGWLGLGGNRFTLHGVIGWVGSVVLMSFALRSRRSPPSDRDERSIAWGNGSLRIAWPEVGLIAAIVVGTAWRLYQLRQLPADLGWDLPCNYTDGERILRAEHLIFFPDNYGREGMFFYLIAGVARAIGLSPYSIRITSALVGVAAIPAIYMLARECFDRETASYAAWLLAANRWHLTLTRSGYRVSLMPLFCILTLYGAARALRRGQARDWAITGIALGLGLWTYKAFAFVIVMLVGGVLFHVIATPRPTPERTAESTVSLSWQAHRFPRLIGLGLALLVALTAALPMIRFATEFPETYLARESLGSDLVAESIERAGITRAQLYTRNILTSALMFNYRGDGNNRFGVPFQRHLGFVSGVLFVWGLALALGRLRKGGNALLCIALMTLTAPMTLSMLAGEAPNCFRASGVIGPALVLAAMALRSWREYLTSMVGERRQHHLALSIGAGLGEAMHTRALEMRLNPFLLAAWLTAVPLALELRETSRAYFVAFRQVAPRIANYSVALALAKHIIAFEEGPGCIKSWPHWYDGHAVQAHLGAVGRTWGGEFHEMSPDQAPLKGFRGKMLVLIHPEDRETLEMLKRSFQRWTVTQERYPSGELSLLAFYGER
ncbi:MAG: glycosyltransferase family 39 protein [Anaerolineae bacterium]|nr:glycosyltransferase family 39 protein [Anaerolineae bacterium]